MDENEYEIHPLDRDYSSPSKAPVKDAPSYHPQLRRVGFIGFAASFIVVFLSAVFLSNVSPGSALETLGSFVHRLGMVGILFSGITIILAYRWPWLQRVMSGNPGLVQGSGHRRLPQRVAIKMSYPVLIVWNVGAFIGSALAIALLTEIGSGYVFGLILRITLTIVFAVAITTIVWKGGFIRAYAIGLLVGLVINSFAGFAAMAGGYWQSDGRATLLVNLAIAMVSGLVCAGYVNLLDSAPPDETR